MFESCSWIAGPSVLATLLSLVVLDHPGGISPWMWDTSVVPGTIVTSAETVLPLKDGEFEIFVDLASSPVNVVVTTDGWASYQWTAFVSAGLHDVGFRIG